MTIHSPYPCYKRGGKEREKRDAHYSLPTPCISSEERREKKGREALYRSSPAPPNCAKDHNGRGRKGKKEKKEIRF